MRRAAALLLLAACGGGGGGSGDPDAGTGADGSGGAIDAAPEADAPPIEPAVPPEIDGRLTINELMAANALTLLDETGAAGDWIELYNPTTTDVPLHGYCVSDDLAHPRAHELADGPVVPAGGYLILWLDGEPARGPTHVDVKLARDGGDLSLARPDGSPIDRIHYDAQETDVSAAREPDGSDHFAIEWLVSPGAANPDGSGQPVDYEDPEAAPEAVPAAGDLTVELYDTSTVIDVQLLVSEEGATSLLADPLTYVPADLVYRGRTYGPIGLRLKGSNSFEPFDQKPSFRIDVDRFAAGARFLGLADLTLNNMDNDPSMMHERLAYEFAREVGVPSSRAAHAFVTVNGEPYGLYTSVETVKHRMLTRWFTDPDGPLFEGTDVDFTAAYIPLYQLESGPDDRSMLTGLASALTTANADAAITAAGAWVDLTTFIHFWAMCAVIGQFDSFPYSDPGDDYFAYADPTTARLQFMPWGMDETWFSPDHDPTQVTSVLAGKCKASPACYQAWVDQVWSLLDVLEQSDYLAKQAAVADQIAAAVAADPRKPYTDEDVATFQDAVRYFLIVRRDYLETVLPPPSVP
ncbi:MAG TPA: CotH kinase family protein [Kofleriaceae bacterium]|nr:CotH kinase family protein [Kofleriaceae bacterium]